MVKNQPKSWLHQEEPAAADNKVIITQALQMLTAGAGELEHLEVQSCCSSDMLYNHLNKGALWMNQECTGSVLLSFSPAKQK